MNHVPPKPVCASRRSANRVARGELELPGAQCFRLAACPTKPKNGTSRAAQTCAASSRIETAVSNTSGDDSRSSSVCSSRRRSPWPAATRDLPGNRTRHPSSARTSRGIPAPRRCVRAGFFSRGSRAGRSARCASRGNRPTRKCPRPPLATVVTRAPRPTWRPCRVHAYRSWRRALDRTKGGVVVVTVIEHLGGLAPCHDASCAAVTRSRCRYSVFTVVPARPGGSLPSRFSNTTPSRS